MSKKRRRSGRNASEHQPCRKKRKVMIGTNGMFFGDDEEEISFSKRVEDEDEEEEEEEEEDVSDDLLLVAPPPSTDRVNEIDNIAQRKSVRNLKKRSRLLKESIISTREREVHLEHTIPQTAEDFERLLFSDRSNSYLWIRYMSYQLGLGEIDRGRNLCHKALKKIDLKRPGERLNIFIAMMNIENYYGTETSQREILDFCIQNCGSKKSIYLHQARLYERNKQIDTCNAYYRSRILKKYSKSKKCLLHYQAYLIRQNRYRECYELFLRVLENLPKAKRDVTIMKMGIQQYKNGSVVEGHKYFHHIIQMYPKRTDFWSTFIQMEINKQRFNEVRKLFQRVLTVNISKFKKKKFLKRYYEFESKHGTEKDLLTVEKIAKEFVNKQIGDDNDD